MKRLLKSLHRYLYAFFTALCFFCLYPLLWLFSRKESHYKCLNKVRKANAFVASVLSGIFYKIHYEEKIDWSRTYVVCANHASNLDIFAMSVLMKNNFFFMGKQELLSSVFTRTYFESVDVPVNRESKMSAYKAYKKADERLKRGMSLIIFPEGKIGNEYPPVLHTFKNGTFKLAIENNIPILPVSLQNNWELFWDDGTKYGTRPGISHIYVHKPIETEDLTLKDEENLKNNVFEIVLSKVNYQAYSQELNNSDED